MKKLYGIGTGPGAADLLTLRAVNVIKDAKVIFAPNNKGKNMALDTVEEYIGDKKVVLIDFPMGSVEAEDYINAANIIHEEIPEGEYGAFLTIGDSMIYSTFIYIMDLLNQRDIEIEVVPGIPSFVAAAAASKVPLTVKGDNFLLIDEFDNSLLDKADSFALLKTLGAKEDTLDELERNDFSYKYVKRVSLENEEILENKEEIIQDRDYISLILGRRKGEK
ncbi:cobalt-precorrin-2 C(20)-methyltransferase [Proteiniborus sp. DW1]|jgi:precorrin-2/cobalt-factor-2 C20-methyltransferase|uniref:precorrin-2 C(20)-methyltransferase n=1 Tax=Proteiniborus sp. DW1 TaxID=1889883 RepID=UPI00092E0A81|nr:precorrin-2 C(20)-methyltransferase [Proteiniborus sp. DW1]SCG82835.1 cobalt-precorrin-2 C(20)-methyltransferase [Proteiniborus sp. DW1]